MGDFKKLAVWNKAHELTILLYQRTADFPRNERFELVSQIRRAASSIGANIAEGSGRGGDGQFGYFLTIAKGSASELENHLLLTRDLGYISDKEHEELEQKLREIGRMLASLCSKVGGVNRADKGRLSSSGA